MEHEPTEHPKGRGGRRSKARTRAHTLEPGATGPGVREWLAEHAGDVPAAAAFDTRIAMPALLTGRASRKIASRLRNKQVRLVAAPESFLVTRKNQLVAGELDHARTWATKLASSLAHR